MEEITAAILNEVERSDPDFIARDVGIEVLPKGLFERRKRLRLFGVVHSEQEKNLVLNAARGHAGSSYEVVDELRVH
jgi:hypothetical protein